MPNLNFHDVDKVKEFVLNILVENAELRESLEFYQKSFVSAWDNYKKAQAELDALKSNKPDVKCEECTKEKGDTAA